MFFSIIYGNIELRSCDEQLLVEDVEHNCAEIICWQDDYCYTLAKWVLDKEGFSLIFVGSRPFAGTIHLNNFITLAKKGQTLLDDYYENTICKNT